MKKIRLTRGRLALVDDEDFKELSKHRWYLRTGLGRTAYAARTIRIGKKCIREYMHRRLLNLNRGDSYEVDHIDGNGLNNVRSNLRLCTRGQQMLNQKRRRNNKSGFKGVHLRKNEAYWKRPWQAYISVNNKRFHLGQYTTAMAAACAYDAAAKRYHGEFARLNS